MTSIAANPPARPAVSIASSWEWPLPKMWTIPSRSIVSATIRAAAGIDSRLASRTLARIRSAVSK